MSGTRGGESDSHHLSALRSAASSSSQSASSSSVAASSSSAASLSAASSLSSRSSAAGPSPSLSPFPAARLRVDASFVPSSASSSLMDVDGDDSYSRYDGMADGDEAGADWLTASSARSTSSSASSSASAAAPAPASPSASASASTSASASASASASSSSVRSLHNPSSSAPSLSHFDAGRSAPRSILRRAAGRKRSLRWDESNLAVNESEKVPRMKVDEPKTPYHAHSSSVGSDSGLDSAGSSAGSFSQQPHRSAFDQHTVDALSVSALERRNEWEDDSSGDELATQQRRPAAADTQPRKRAAHSGASGRASSDNTAIAHSQPEHTAQEEAEGQAEGEAEAEAEAGADAADEEVLYDDEPPQSADSDVAALRARNGSESADGLLPSSDSDSAAGGLPEDADAQAKHARFEKLRKQHYKMGDALKAHHNET